MRQWYQVQYNPANRRRCWYTVKKNFNTLDEAKKISAEITCETRIVKIQIVEKGKNGGNK